MKNGWVNMTVNKTFTTLSKKWLNIFVDEKTAADVSDGPAYSGSDGSRRRNSILCLKRPSFYCLIHFYKRCVSSLAPMGRSP